MGMGIFLFFLLYNFQEEKNVYETVRSMAWLSLSLGPKSIILHRITAFIRLIHKPRKSLFFLSLSQWIEIKALIFFWVIVPVKLEWVPRKLDVNKWIFILRFRAIYLHLILIIEYIYIYYYHDQTSYWVWDNCPHKILFNWSLLT